MPSLEQDYFLDKDESSDNESDNGSLPALGPRIESVDKPILPALVAHAKDSDEDSWVSLTLKTTLATVMFHSEKSCMITTTTRTTTLGIW